MLRMNTEAHKLRSIKVNRLICCCAAVLMLCVGCKGKMMQTGNLSEEEQQRRLERMLARDIAARDIRDPRVLRAMRVVPRHKFVPEAYQHDAYEDYPLPIGYDQTISQPYIVAYMSQALELKGNEKVLEIGTGSGYQAAVLCELAAEVFSIEIVEPLCRAADDLLENLGYRNVHVLCGDGYLGWPEHAPFDAVILTAAPAEIPTPLLEQLAEGGRMILPLGSHSQTLVLIRKRKGQIIQEHLLPVRFVPMTGEAEKSSVGK